MQKLFGLTNRGTLEYAFATREEAEEFAASHPMRVRRSGGGETTEFYTVGEAELPAVVRCVTCRLAGRETIVTAKDPKKYPYCKGCFYTGQATEHLMGNTIAKLRRAFPDAEVAVHHTGGGCFLLAVELADGTYYGMTGEDFECLTIAKEGVGCICRYRDVEPCEEFEHGATEMALVYEGYGEDYGEGELAKVTVAKAIGLVRKDIRKPAPAEII